MKVLLVDDDPAIREALGQTLELEGLTPVLAGSFLAVKDHLTPTFDGVVVTDMRMPGRDGFHLLDYARKTDPDLPVILLTGEGDIPMAVKAIASGAYDFLEKPCGPSAFLAVVTRALKARGLVLENRRLAAVVAQGDAASRLLRGVSPQADELRSQSRRVAALGTDALITGDRGSGTAKVAEVVHLLSPAAARAFVKQSAGQLDVSSLAHVLDRAAGGTLYLDEITRLPEDVQYALLDRIEGGAGARILAGTTVPIEPGDLLEDLFYHFDILRIHIPPLCGRKVDIPVLFRHYVEQACEQANLPMPDIGSEVIARLMAQDVSFFWLD